MWGQEGKRGCVEGIGGKRVVGKICRYSGHWRAREVGIVGIGGQEI